MAKDLMDLLLDQFFDARRVGKRGEKLMARELNLVRLFGRGGKVLRNVYVPKGNGETSEIDVLFITQKGIFVFESKNYSGWVFGDEASAYWTVMLPNQGKNRLYNPIKQNRTHIKWLGNYLGVEIPFFSIIVFSERCELKKITVASSDIHVIQRERTYTTVRDIWDSSPDVIGPDEVQQIYDKLQPLANADAAVKQAHIDSINKKYSSPEKPFITPAAESDSPPNDSSETILCPKCGSPLVLRTAAKGSNAGKQFYGCSTFPRCRYIRNL